MITGLSSRGFIPPIVQVGTNRSANASTRAGARSRIRQAVEEPLFRDILIREWRRADRFDQSFVLVLVELTVNATEWGEIIKHLTALIPDTDVIGWFEQDRVLGLLWLDRDGSNACAVREIEPRKRVQCVGVGRRPVLERRVGICAKMCELVRGRPLRGGLCNTRC